MTKRIWISRDKDRYNDNEYNVHEKEPVKSDFSSSGYCHSEVACFCPDYFESLTGIKLEPGQFTQMEVKQVGDVWEFTD